MNIWLKATGLIACQCYRLLYKCCYWSLMRLSYYWAWPLQGYWQFRYFIGWLYMAMHRFPVLIQNNSSFSHHIYSQTQTFYESAKIIFKAYLYLSLWSWSSKLKTVSCQSAKFAFFDAESLNTGACAAALSQKILQPSPFCVVYSLLLLYC